MAEKKAEDDLYLARISHLSGDQDNTIKYVTEIVKLKRGKITEEERNLLFGSLKTVINFRREAWRTVDAVERKEKPSPSKYFDRVITLKNTLATEISTYISSALELIEKYLMKNEKKDEVKVTYSKIRGDYQRYLLELVPKEEKEKRNEIKKIAKKFYKEGYVICGGVSHLSSAKVAMILNYTVFLYENMGYRRKAYNIANEAYQKTIKAISDDNYDLSLMKDLNKLLGMLKENIDKWEPVVKNLEEEKDEEEEMELLKAKEEELAKMLNNANNEENIQGGEEGKEEKKVNEEAKGPAMEEEKIIEGEEAIDEGGNEGEVNNMQEIQKEETKGETAKEEVKEEKKEEIKEEIKEEKKEDIKEKEAEPAH